MTIIEELAAEVCSGNITSVEVYEDYFKAWSKDERSLFLAKLTAAQMNEVIADTRWDNLTYDHCRHCIEYLKRKWHEEDMSSQGNSPNTSAEERTIDEEAIGNWFNARFKGAGNGNINYLKENLIPELKQSRSNKEFAKIAFLIHNSNYCLCGNKTFSKFYQDFCLAVGCQQKKYTPCNLKDEEFARKFYYL